MRAIDPAFLRDTFAASVRGPRAVPAQPGDVFGMLTVIESHRGRARVRCACGWEAIVMLAALRGSSSRDPSVYCGTCETGETHGPRLACSTLAIAKRTLARLQSDIARPSSRRREGLVCTLTLDDMQGLMAKVWCVYCARGISPDVVGLDRIDNARGYEPGNVVRACTGCNVARGSLIPADMFAEMVKRMLEAGRELWPTGHPQSARRPA